MVRHQREALVVDVEGHDRSTQRRRDLDAETAHTAHAHENREVALAESAAANGLIGCGNRVGDDGQGRQVEAAGIHARVIEIGDGAQAVRRHADVGREAAVDVAPEEHLLRAYRTVAFATSVALPARNDGGDDDATIDPTRRAEARLRRRCR